MFRIKLKKKRFRLITDYAKQPQNNNHEYIKRNIAYTKKTENT